MKRLSSLFVQDILEAITAVEQFTQNISFEEFMGNEQVRSAVLWQIAMIGEAAKAIEPALKKKYNHIPWKEMAGIRDRITHGYFGIRYEIVWNVIREKFPDMKIELQNIKEDMKGETLFD
ncbi:MAG: DUF86 domain-containing protein [Ignavibacteriae bacterium]|nr:DUF86 domain-containing protein [Ignavibacteriota bacterium]